MLRISEALTEVKIEGLGKIRFITRVYPKVSGLATWSENCKWYSSLP
jgi:hypothetical protein